MRVPFNDLRSQHESLQPQLREAMQEVIETSSFIRGAQVGAFEEAFARALGARHCVSCASGTDALYISMRALGVKPGDEVITTAHSWISTSETITQAGGRVVFCDTDDETLTLQPKAIEEKITARTVGVIPVHLYGQPADMTAIMEIAGRHSLWVIEDCAQAHLATFRGRRVGTFGETGIFSFYPGKNLGAMGDAGCIVTNDDALASWTAMFARHGGKGDHQIEGINSRMDTLQAAVLQVKLPHVARWTEARTRTARLYDDLLSGVGDVVAPKVASHRDHVYHLYVVRTDHRDALRLRLKEGGVETGLHYPKALPFYPAYAYLGHKPQDFPVAYANQSRILSLPIYPEMTLQMVNHTADIIRGFFGAGPAT